MGNIPKFKFFLFLVLLLLLPWNLSAQQPTSPTKAGKIEPSFAPDRIIVKYKKNTLAPLPSSVIASVQNGDEVPIKHFRGSKSIDALHAKHHVKGMRKVFHKHNSSSTNPSASNKNTALDDLVNQDIYVLEMSTKNKIKEAVEDFKKDPNVEYAQPDYIMKTSFTPNDSFFTSAGSWGQTYDDLWGLKKINAPQAWDTKQGQGIIVAVVDTGVDYKHPDIAANIVPGWNFVDNNSDPMDNFGHGTHVAGTIAAIGNNNLGIIGVAPQAKIMPLKGLDDSGSGDSSILANAIVYAAQHNAKVINNSWGCGYYCPSDPIIEDAVRTAESLGAVVIFAAGNSTMDVTGISPQNMTDHKPIIVAASQPDNSLTPFSNNGNLIDVTAPGSGFASVPQGILSLKSSVCDPNICQPNLIVGSQYLRLSGTSMAAPHVSGLAALILSNNPNLSNIEVTGVLKSSANPIPGLLGAGLIDAAKALSITNPISAQINLPAASSYLNSTLPITINGTASTRYNFKNYSLSYKTLNKPDAWTTIASSNFPVVNGILGTWDISRLKPFLYLLRLQVWSTDQALPVEQTSWILIPDKSIYPISSDNSVTALAIDGNNIAWIARSKGLFWYNLSTKETIAISTNNINKLFISNGFIIYDEPATSTRAYPQIVLYNTATRSLSYLHPDHFTNILTVDGNRIYYHNDQSTLPDYYYDLVTQQIINLAIPKISYPLSSGSITLIDSVDTLTAESNIVYGIGMSVNSSGVATSGNQRVITYDLMTNNINTIISSFPQINTGFTYSPSFSGPAKGGHVLVNSNYNPKNEILVLNKNNLSQIDHVLVNSKLPPNPSLSISKMSWTENDLINIKDFAYGMDDPISSLFSRKFALTMNDQNLVWADDQGIFVYPIPPEPFPVFQTVGTVKAVVGTMLSIPIKATDPTGSKLTLTVSGTGPVDLGTYMPGSTFRDNGDGTGTLSWIIPSNLPAKVYNLNFTATNARGMKSSTLVTVNLVTSTINGFVDQVLYRGDGTYSVLGWACATNLNQSVSVQMYIGGAAGTPGSVLYTTSNANLPSSAAVATACNSTGTNYRFDLKFGADTIASYAGKPIVVYGISPFGSNIALQNPTNAIVPVSSVIGYIDAITSNGDGTYAVLGWACSANMTQSIDVQLYLGGPAGSPGSVLYTTGKASLSSEPAVANVCRTTATNYRFNLKLGADAIASYGGRPFAIYGVSPVGGPNNALTNGNNLILPTITYKMGATYSNDVLSGWPSNNVIDDNPNTNYSSTIFATGNNDRSTYLGAWMDSQKHDVNKIILTARKYNSKVQAFPLTYDIYLTSPDNTQWIFMGTYSNQPDANGGTSITLSKYYSTYGVLIVPRTLGVDDNNSHYFQMAEVKLSQ